METWHDFVIEPNMETWNFEPPITCSSSAFCYEIKCKLPGTTIWRKGKIKLKDK